MIGAQGEMMVREHSVAVGKTRAGLSIGEAEGPPNAMPASAGYPQADFHQTAPGSERLYPPIRPANPYAAAPKPAAPDGYAKTPWGLVPQENWDRFRGR
jgi:hypothetical protein